MENLFEKQLNTTNVFRGLLLDVYSDDILLPNGNTSKREYIKHVGAACVVPVDNDGNIIIEKQFRYPFSKVLTEIPAGKLDSKDEPHLDAALRELREETGYTAEKMVYLGEYIPTCAYSDEVIHMYLAQGISFTERELDDDEFLDVEFIELDTLYEMTLRGEICDAKTQIAVLKAYEMKKRKTS